MPRMPYRRTPDRKCGMWGFFPCNCPQSFLKRRSIIAGPPAARAR